MSMPLKATVRGGRLVLDEPTDLPEGTEVQLVALDGEATERARIDAMLDAGLEEVRAARSRPVEEFLAERRDR